MIQELTPIPIRCEEVVADGSGDSQYYYEGSNLPGGILGGVVQSTPGFWDDDQYDFSGFDGDPLDIRIGVTLVKPGVYLSTSYIFRTIVHVLGQQGLYENSWDIW